MAQFETSKDNGKENKDVSLNEEEETCPLPAAKDLKPIEIPPYEHVLQHKYWLWYSKRPSLSNRQYLPTKYSQALQLVARVATVEQWWGMYCHLVRLSDLPAYTDLHLFKEGIQPMWEDPANAKGGKWVVRFKKGLVGKAWENLCMAMLGEQFMVGNEICGAVVSIRYPEDIISLWNRNACDQTTTTRIRDILRRILELTPNVPMDYKSHGESLKAWKTVPTYKERANP